MCTIRILYGGTAVVIGWLCLNYGVSICLNVIVSRKILCLCEVREV